MDFMNRNYAVHDVSDFFCDLMIYRLTCLSSFTSFVIEGLGLSWEGLRRAHNGGSR